MAKGETASPVVDRPEKQRYEMAIDGDIAFADYHLSGDSVLITHVEVPRAHEGRGLGSRLMKGVLADIRARGRKVVPRCGFARDYLRRHPEEHDLLP
jgi:hypothetical protein